MDGGYDRELLRSLDEIDRANEIHPVGDCGLYAHLNDSGAPVTNRVFAFLAARFPAFVTDVLRIAIFEYAGEVEGRWFGATRNQWVPHEGNRDCQLCWRDVFCPKRWHEGNVTVIRSSLELPKGLSITGWASGVRRSELSADNLSESRVYFDSARSGPLLLNLRGWGDVCRSMLRYTNEECKCDIRHLSGQRVPWQREKWISETPHTAQNSAVVVFEILDRQSHAHILRMVHVTFVPVEGTEMAVANMTFGSVYLSAENAYQGFRRVSRVLCIGHRGGIPGQLGIVYVAPEYPTVQWMTVDIHQSGISTRGVRLPLQVCTKATLVNAASARPRTRMCRYVHCLETTRAHIIDDRVIVSMHNVFCIFDWNGVLLCRTEIPSSPRCEFPPFGRHSVFRNACITDLSPCDPSVGALFSLMCDSCVDSDRVYWKLS